MSKDYYKILGVTESNTAEEIKQAYRRLARKYHPDVTGESLESLKIFKDINEAYEILSNTLKKAEYDRARRFYEYARSNNNPEPKETDKKEESKNNGRFRFNDFFTNFSFEKKVQNEFKNPVKGKDVYSELEISYVEALEGVLKTINLLQKRVCSSCKGRKFVNGSICNHCHGKGEQVSYNKYSVKIPAGIKSGSKIRLAGAGELGKNGGANGDLYLKISVNNPNGYRIEGLNILKKVSITPFEAVLGTSFKINTPNGETVLEVLPNTQNGQKICLSGCGIVQNKKIGDMIITLEIKIPKSLTDDEISLYKRLEEISSCNIRDKGNG